MISKQVIFGPPGTGKTTRLLQIMEKELKTVSPGDIAFVSFTRKAVAEARERACTKFNYDPEELPFFRTVHSICFSMINVVPFQVMNQDNYLEIAELLGLEYERSEKYIQFDSVNRTNDDTNLWEEWNKRVHGTAQVIYTTNDEYRQQEQVSKIIERYKEIKGRFDFTDFLERALIEGKPLPVRVAIIDEAQDLSPLQWDVIEYIFRDCERLYMAGDDDQAIFGWAGANVKRFINLDAEKSVLRKSYRMPKRILALSQTIVSQLHDRYPKDILPKNDIGEVNFFPKIEYLDINPEGSVFMLARTRRQLKIFTEYCQRLGYPYLFRNELPLPSEYVWAIINWENARGKGKKLSGKDWMTIGQFLGERRRLKEDQMYSFEDMKFKDKRIWHDALKHIPIDIREYVLGCLRRKEKPWKPRIQINTIHGVKGGEADQVILLMDVPKTILRSFRTDPDPEHRVFYVGVTRGKQRVDIIRPRTSKFYPMRGI